MPTIGQPAPAFVLSNQDRNNIALKNLKGKWVVLYFYPKDNTPGCTTEAIDFTRLHYEFKKRGAIIIGISPDSVKSHCNFIDKQTLSVMLLSDPDKEVITEYGVWGEKKFMGRKFMGVIRSTFLINPQGKIVQIWNNVQVAGHAEEVLNALKRMQRVVKK